jgi:pimeloyl-ACP methyl ester carboxylesterase
MNSSLSPSAPIPFFDLNGSGPPLHFLHANGYPPECYQPFLERLQTQYHVFGMLLRPLWQDSSPYDILDWKPFSDDLLQFLASQSAPVIGVGHSIGALVTLRAALRDPSKFRALILIDPVLFVPSRLILWKLFFALGLGDRVYPLIRRAKKRRRMFDNLEQVFHRYRGRNVFGYMSDENLQNYIKGITRKTKDGYELRYSPDWESQIYRTGLQDFDIWRGLPKLEVPTLFLRGAETDTFLENAAALIKRMQPRACVETLERSTHLLPLERPQEAFDIVKSFLQEIPKVSNDPLRNG